MTTNKTANVPAKPNWAQPTSIDGLRALMSDQLRAEINNAVPRILRGHANRLLRCLLTECSTNPALLDCTPASLFGGVVRAAQLGLVIGGPTGESYLIPFGNSKKGVKEATLIVGYRGYLQLAHRSGQVRRVTPRTVRQGDQFYVRYGSGQAILHEPVRNNTEPETDFYVILETVTGGIDFECASREEMVAHRDRYATVRNAPQYVRDKSPWYSTGPEFAQMCHKTLIRRLAKRMPLSADMNLAIGLDEQAEVGLNQHLAGALGEVLPESAGGPPDDSTADDLQGRLDDAAGYVPGVDDPDFEKDMRNTQDPNDGRR